MHVLPEWICVRRTGCRPADRVEVHSRCVQLADIFYAADLLLTLTLTQLTADDEHLHADDDADDDDDVAVSPV